MHRIVNIWFCVMLGGIFAGTNLRAERPDKIILAHYMPWYATKAFSGQWGWHWTMNHFEPDRIRASGQREIASHDYPLMDLYDSNDPDALECQVLLMKLAGIDGVVIDWYGREAFYDYAEIHRNTVLLIAHLKKAGLQFAICFEDQTVKHLLKENVLTAEQTLRYGKEVIQWLDQNWFGDASYVTLDGRPVFLVFGPQHYGKDQWPALLAGASRRPLFYTLPYLTREMGADGAFGWPPVSGDREIPVEEWRSDLEALYGRAHPEKSVMGVAYPGFHDIYREAQLQYSCGFLDSRNGQTFEETFDRALKSEARILQIATWNDYGEGTVIEPTRANGYRYLEYVQKNTPAKTRFTAEDLRLPLRLYELKKRHAQNPERRRLLQPAADALYAGECAKARGLLATFLQDSPANNLEAPVPK